MLDLSELNQFVTYAQCGTLSAAAEVLHISQPTLTRTMRHVEESFGVELFHRSKNHMELTRTGQLAVERAQELLSEAEKAVSAVQAFEQSLHTITVDSCAPAPLWSLLPVLSHRFPENTISSRLTTMEEITESVRTGKADIGILPYPCPDRELVSLPYLKEQLFVCVPEEHGLTGKTSVTFAQLNGFNCLLRDHIGFWTDLVKQKMPASRFLVQTDEFEFEELVRTSTLLNFATDLSNPGQKEWNHRRIIPVTDDAATITYHLICRKESRKLLPL